MRPSKFGLGVHYKLSVIERDGREIPGMPRKRNLILDSGLDLAASEVWAQLFAYAVAGTGTNPVKRDSGAVTFSRAGNVVTASAGFFDAGDVGRLIKWDTGEEAYISVYTSGTSVETIDSGTIAAAEGTVWYVNRTGLQAEVKRTNTYGSDSGDNETTFVGGVITMKRTFVFSAEAGAITYNEIGWSYTPTAGSNLFGMDIISGGVSLGAGQKLKVIVELSIDLTPKASTPWANVITGWSQDGDCSLESVPVNVTNVISYVGTNGGTNMNLGGLGALEPSQNKNVSLCNDSAALAGITSSSIPRDGFIAQKQSSKEPYITGSFTRDFVSVFDDSEGNSAAIRSILSDNGNVKVFRVLLDAPEEKDSDHQLSITMSLSWGRVLVN